MSSIECCCTRCMRSTPRSRRSSADTACSKAALTAARPELGEYAPRIEVIKIPVDKIREVIGTGGKVIREIVEKTGAKIDIQDDGTVKVASSSGAAITAAMKWIKSIVS